MEVDISAEKFFMTVNLFGLVEYATCDLLPTALYMFAEGYASLKRIQVLNAVIFPETGNYMISLLQDFLTDEEINHFESNKCMIQHEHKSGLNQTAVQITSLSCYWDKNEKSSTIENITASFKQGSLNTIAGPVGCGKVDTHLT